MHYGCRAYLHLINIFSSWQALAAHTRTVLLIRLLPRQQTQLRNLQGQIKNCLPTFPCRASGLEGDLSASKDAAAALEAERARLAAEKAALEAAKDALEASKVI